MTPAEYILSPQFETIMCAVKVNDQPHMIVDGPDFPAWIKQFNPDTTTTVTFNSLFDNAILSWRYGFVPATMIDAMAMARTIDGHKLVKFSLAALAEHLGLPAKGGAVHNARGLHRADILAGHSGLTWKEYGDYCIHDNELCEGIFNHYLPKLPWAELRLMDMVLRCCVEPHFICDTVMLDQHIKDVVAAKDQLLVDAGNVDKTIVMSTPKFKAALEALGVDIEYKPSPSDPDKELPAFSKTDEFMETLLNSPDKDVAALAAARIGLKSTLEETRSGTLMRIGLLDWPRMPWETDVMFATRQLAYQAGHQLGMMPIPLRYGGAHTHRLSGDWRMNMQNMPTVRGSKGKSKLRLSLKAPDGHKVVVIDLGQIEARLVAWLCQDMTLLNEFAKKLDPYNQLASTIFGRAVNRKLAGTDDEIMGFIGKTGILGLGYGAGKDKFDSMVISSSRSQGVDISQIYNRQIGDKAVDAYRRRYFMIPAGWNRLSGIIGSSWMGKSPPVKFGPNGVAEIGEGYVLLPNGLRMEYDEPQERTAQDKKTGQWRTEYSYRYGKMRHRLYGAKLLENISQAIARIIVMNAALRIRDRGRHTSCPWAYRFKHQAHDELVYIIPDSELAAAKQIIYTEMIRSPSWGRDIPLTADIGVGQSYGEAK